MTIAESGQQTDIASAVLITYSSVERGGYVDPSRLTKLAALASRQYFGESPVDLIIAGEESYKDRSTTGELLGAKYQYDLLPKRSNNIILPAGPDRLLNTTVQMEAVADYAASKGIGSLAVIGWGFHEDRVTTLLGNFVPEIALDYTRVEDVLADMQDRNPSQLAAALQEIGFKPGLTFDQILGRGLVDFDNRERLTRIISGGKGRIIKLLSRLRNSGRYDELDSQGFAKMSTTDTPWYKF